MNGPQHGSVPSRHCLNCGQRFGEADRFCGRCGTPRQFRPQAPATPVPPTVTPTTYAAGPSTPPPSASARPGAAQPGAAQSGGSRPSASRPSASQSSGSRPSASQPSAAQSSGSRPDVPAASPGRGRRWAILVASGMTLALVLGLLGWFGYGWWRDRPAHRALAAAAQPWSTALEDVRAADEMPALGEAAGSATTAAAEIGRLAEDLTGDDDSFRGRARALLRGQSAFLTSLGALATLDEESLAGWAEVHSSLEESATALGAALSTLGTHDTDIVEEVADPGPALAQVRTVVGGFVRETVQSSLTDLLAGLSGVTSTADLRALAQTAAQHAEITAASTTGLEQNTESTQLTAAGAAFGALAGLAEIDGRSLDRWPAARDALTAALADLEELSGLGTAAIAHADGLIARATATVDAWRQERSAARQVLRAERRSLSRYERVVRNQLGRYNTLRQRASGHLSSQATARPRRLSSFLRAAARDRRSVRNTLRDQNPPNGTEGPHQELVGLLGDATRAVSRASSEIRGWVRWCARAEESCTFREHPGYQAFSAESARISRELGVVQGRWESAVRTVRSGLTKDRLPARPEV